MTVIRPPEYHYYKGGGKNGKGIIKLVNTYKEIGIKDVSYILYKDGRHEMLNEINKDEVIENVVKWLEKKKAR